MDTADTLLGVFISLSLITVGLFFGYLALANIKKQIDVRRLAEASTNWPSTSGEITSMEIRWVGVRARSPKPDAVYEYCVNGINYTSKQLAFDGGKIYTREEANEVAARYAPGTAVTVYYDPHNPQASTLEQRHVGVANSLLISAVLLFSPTAFCIIIGLIGLLQTLGR